MRRFNVEKFTRADLVQLAHAAQVEGHKITLTSKKQLRVFLKAPNADIANSKPKNGDLVGSFLGVSVLLCIPPQASKFNAKKVELDGYKFDSKSEAAYYEKLKADSEVEIIEIHPKHVLMRAFTDNKGYRHRAIEYEADFAYRKAGVLYFVDIKGLLLPEFRIKWKLFTAYMNTVDPTIMCLALDKKGNDLYLPKPIKRKTTA